MAKAFGYENWNILAAKIDAAQLPSGAASQQGVAQAKLLYCSFCGKSQHEVSKLVAGPAVYICDECVGLCTDVVDEQLIRLVERDEDSARAMSTDRLLHDLEHARKGAERNRLGLQRIERMRAFRGGASAIDDGLLQLPSFAQLMTKTSDELRAMQQFSQAQLKRYEQAQRTARSILDQRKQ